MRSVTVLELFRASVRRHPQKTAVIEPERSLSYQELDDEARAFSRGLEASLCHADKTPVVLFMDKGCLCLSAMLGSLMSAHPYVPMDAKTPLPRLESILETLGSRVIAASAEGKNTLDAMGYEGSVLIAEELIESGRSLPESAPPSVIDTDLMYVLFTSGSTGVPKGVAVMHRSLVDYVENASAAIGIGEEDIVGNQTPFYADMSLKDIYMTLSAGATLVIIPQKYFMTPKKLLNYLEEHKVSFIAWVPTAYRMIAQFDGLSKVHPAALKKFVFSGETMPIPVYRYFRRFYPDAAYTQLYGPTEITGACTFFKVGRDYADNETIPIGRPFRNTGLILLDEEDRLIPPETADVPGEICVFGSCLAAGYYRDPDKTAAAFVRNPLITDRISLMYRTGDLACYNAEGELVFISRKDLQIKHGGRRIELGEIEAAANAAPGVDACCAVHDRRKDELVLYYIGSAERKELGRFLQDRLPKYMIPGALLRLDALPQLTSGKLDRNAMDRMANEGEQYA